MPVPRGPARSDFALQPLFTFSTLFARTLADLRFMDASMCRVFHGDPSLRRPEPACEVSVAKAKRI
jgi:hypothetical protein